MFFKRVFGVVLLSCVLGGCGKTVTPAVQESVHVPQESVKNPSNVVLLSDVNAPTWNETYAVMECEDFSICVDWGISDKNAVMEECSGFPGFNKPIIITGVSENVSGRFTLVTEYGEFVYEVAEVRNAVLNDVRNNVVEVSSGKELVDWGAAKEMVYLVNSEERKVIIADYVYGTDIIL